MAFDFWNNPLVVSALRVKHRRGSLFASLMLYVGFLSCACVGAWYGLEYLNAPALVMNDEQRLFIIFGGLLIFQLLLATLISLVMTSTAMTQEVNDGTLEYQRLTRLTPARILLGKLLGQPVIIHLMTMAWVPFTFGIWALGVPKISLGSLLLVYVNIATTIILGGSLGLLHSLKKKEQGQMGGAGMAVLIGLVIFYGVILQLAMFGGVSGMLARPQSAAFTCLLLPLGSLTGLFRMHDPWYHTLSFFGLQLPFLVVTPLAQLTLASLCFVRMTRRLTNTVVPGFSKPMAYGILIGIDVLAAGVLCDVRAIPMELWQRTTQFWFLHLLVSALMVVIVTPDHGLLSSWLWRFRGRCSHLRDLWQEDRSENVLVLLTCCLLGLALWGLLVVGPAVATMGWTPDDRADEAMLQCIVLVCTWIITLGTFYQCWLFTVGRGATTMLVTLLFADLLVFGFGQHWEWNLLKSFSAIAHWTAWNTDPLPLGPALVPYALLLPCSWILLRRSIRREADTIRQKLQDMGVRPADGNPI